MQSPVLNVSTRRLAAPARALIAALTLLTSSGICAAQRSQSAPTQVLASQSADAIVAFIRMADKKGSDVIVRYLDHRHRKDPEKYPDEFKEVRLTITLSGMLHMSLRPRKLQFAEFVPNDNMFSLPSERYQKAYRYIILAKTPNHPVFQFTRDGESYDLVSVRLAGSVLPPAREARSLSVIIDSDAAGRWKDGHVDSGYRLRYGLPKDDPSAWISPPILYRHKTSADIYFDLSDAAIEQEKMTKYGLQRRLVGRWLEIPASEMHNKDAYIKKFDVSRPRHPAWSYFVLEIDDRGRVRGGRCGMHNIPDRYRGR